MIRRLAKFATDRWDALPYARRDRLTRLALWLRFWPTEVLGPWLGRNYVWFVIAFAVAVLVLAYFGEGIAFDLYRAVASTAARLASEPLTPDAFWRYALSLGALLAALAAAAAIPFQLIKTWLNERATSAAEQAAITQRITEAVQMLGATREEKVRRRLTAWYPRDTAEYPGSDFSIRYVYEYEGRPPPLPFWFIRLPSIAKGALEGDPKDEAERLLARLVDRAPDGWMASDFVGAEEFRPILEVRLGALFALERLSQDSRRDHVSLMKTVCAYIRANFPSDEAIDLGLPGWLTSLSHSGSLAESEVRAALYRWQSAFADDLSRHCEFLPEPRADLQTALALLGGRAPARRWLERRDATPYALDLRAASLQRSNLRGLHLSHALLTRARMEGANLREARMEEADLSGARMEGANLSGARMEGADLSRARMEGADLSRARMEGADLSEARMEVANLSRARMEGANLRGARMEGAVLYEVRMEGAFLLEALFGHSLIWYTSMKSALISHVTFDGAGLMSADFSNSFYVEPVASRTTFLSAFGDGSVLLPEGVAAPAHWPEESLTKSAFLARWRGWRESRGLPWPPPGRALSDEVFSGAVFGLGFGLFDLPSIPATPPNRPVDPSEIADP